MNPVEIRPDIYWIGVNDRTTRFFEGIWPIEREGVTYNAYLIDDEKKLLIDLVKETEADEFFERLAQITDLSRIDYVVVNHMEPDHTGALNILKKIVPGITVLATPKARPMLEAFYGITDRVREVADGETLSLGRHELKFVYTPYVHWPETMMTYETSEKILFSTDGFGSFGTVKGWISDDQCPDLEHFKREALRYFTNIVATFSNPVLKAIDKLAALPVEIVAPGHGLVWRKDPQLIVDLYRRWAEYSRGQTELGITLIYGSMYGNTERVMEAVSQGITDEGVPLQVFNVTTDHVSYMLPSLWVNQGVMIGVPTYEGSLFPLVSQAIDMAAEKRVMNKKTAVFSSYGWSAGAVTRFKKMIEPLKWELTDSFEFAGGATYGELDEARKFGRNFARLLKQGRNGPHRPSAA